MLLHAKKIGLFLLFSAVACTSGNQTGSGAPTNLFGPKPSNLRVSLTDAPIDHVSSVNVNIDHIELLLEKGGKQAHLEVAKDLGMVNLLDLQNGVLLALSDIEMPDAVSVRQIRLILNGEGNHLIKDNGDFCQLQTPSAQKSGVKIPLREPVVFENGYSYSMVIDFDAKKSIVIKGNGECLLKPVLRLKYASRVPQDQISEDGGTTSPGDDLTDGQDTNDSVNNDGYDDEYNGSCDVTFDAGCLVEIPEGGDISAYL